METLQDITKVVLLGIGATVFMDGWLSLLTRMGIRTLDFALIGRWIGHLGRGTFAHASIAKSPPIPAELALGWLTHYAVGIGFAGLLVSMQGLAWMRSPSLLPALAVGVGSVAAPFLLMQPAMGAGIAASRTPTPAKNRLRSLANHAVFGLGLYLSAVVIGRMSQS